MDSVPEAIKPLCEAINTFIISPLMILVAAFGRIGLLVLNAILFGFAIWMIAGGAHFIKGNMVESPEVDGGEALKKVNEILKKGDKGVSLGDGSGGNSEFVSVGIAVVVGGVVLLIISFLGAAGGLFANIWMLKKYCLMLEILIILELILCIYVFTRKATLEEAMYMTLQGYKGIEGTDDASTTWNTRMTTLQCCGVRSYVDFHTLKSWRPELFTLETPVACCKTKFLDDTYDCARAGKANDLNNNMNKGCAEVIFDTTLRNPQVISAVVIFFIAQVTLLLIAYLIVRRAQSEEK